MVLACLGDSRQMIIIFMMTLSPKELSLDLTWELIFKSAELFLSSRGPLQYHIECGSPTAPGSAKLGLDDMKIVACSEGPLYHSFCLYPSQWFNNKFESVDPGWVTNCHKSEEHTFADVEIFESGWKVIDAQSAFLKTIWCELAIAGCLLYSLGSSIMLDLFSRSFFHKIL